MFLDQIQSGEDEDEDYRPHWEIHWKVKIILIAFIMDIFVI